MKLPDWVNVGVEVDETTFGKEIDLEDMDNLTEGMINGQIIYHQSRYIKRQYRDVKLWNELKEDFEGWNDKIFAMANKETRREFRDYLRSHGVWVAKDNKKISVNLMSCIDEVEQHRWAATEVEAQLSTGNEFYSKWNTSDKASVPTGGFIATTQLPLPPPLPDIPLENQYEEEIPLSQECFTPAPTPITRTDTSLTKMITDLAKFYISDDKKYGGEAYDILDTKLQIFKDCCEKVGMPEVYYHKGYSLMLKGRASRFYYSSLTTKEPITFETMVCATKVHFETEENRQLYMSDWRETTYPRIIAANPSKSRLECLQLLYDKLQQVQEGLSKEYQQDYNLREQVISACRGVKECSLALYNPADTYEGVCAQLRSAVGTAEREKEASQQFTTENDSHDNLDEQYWVDRKYNGNGRGHRGYGGSRGGFRPSGAAQDHNQGGYGRGGYSRGNSFQQGRGGRQGGFRPSQKKCYVCGNPGCWSTKHPKQDQQTTYNRYRQ